MPDLFRAIIVETIGACDNACYFCRYGQKRWISKQRPIDKLTLESISKIIENLRRLDYVGRVSFHGISEPLLEERLPVILRMAKLALPNAHHTLITNGNQLTQDVSNLLFDSGLDHLTVSAYTDETWTKANGIVAKSMNVKDRRPSAKYQWSNRAGNIAQLRKHKKEGDCKCPSTGLVVNARGDVILCSADLYGDVIMGSIHENSLEEIWFGDAFEKYRKQLSTGIRSGLKLCEGCDYDGSGYKRAGN